VEQSVLETSDCLELAGIIKIYLIAVHTFRATHPLVRTKNAVTSQLVNSQIPGWVRFIPHYVKSATRSQSKGRQTQCLLPLQVHIVYKKHADNYPYTRKATYFVR